MILLFFNRRWRFFAIEFIVKVLEQLIVCSHLGYYVSRFETLPSNRWKPHFDLGSVIEGS
jgi:hypothetical protein